MPRSTLSLICRTASVCLVGALASSLSLAQDWPRQPIKLIVPFPPGGTSDIVARVIQAPLSEKLKQPVIVDNRPGAGTTIGAKAVLSANDGAHTLFVANSAPVSIGPFLFDTPPYDPIKDFAYVGMIGTVPNAFFVASDVPAKSWRELADWIKAQGKAVPFGSGGGGSIGHIVGEMYKSELKLDMEHVAYKGSSPMFQDMLGGHLKFGVNTLPEVWELAKANKLRVVAITGPQRSKIAPEVPTTTELGHPKLVAENFVGLSGPAGMPAAAVARLNAVLNEILSDSKVIARLEEMGFTVMKSTPTQFTAFAQKQVTEFQPAIKASGAKLQ